MDEHGNVADVIMDPNSTIGRMNVGRLYEQYFNTASRDLLKEICTGVGVPPSTKARIALKTLQRLDAGIVQHVYTRLLDYYKILSPVMRSWFDDGLVQQSPIEYLADIIERGITIFLPTNNQPELEDMVLQIEEHYRPLRGPVSFLDENGVRVVTKDDVRIGESYFILLEKIGDDWSAVSSGKVQHFGVLAPVTKADKYSKPARNNAVRGSGEAEFRGFVSYVGSEFSAELMDRNNNPKTHKHMVRNILSAPQPGNIKNLVDRSVEPLGGSKPLQLMHHLAEISGFRFKYELYVPNKRMVP